MILKRSRRMGLTRSRFLAFLAFFLLGCHDQTKENEIHSALNNGEPVSKGSFQSIVKILINEEICTGVHVRNFILTAAHCFEKSSQMEKKEFYSLDQVKVIPFGHEAPISTLNLKISGHHEKEEDSIHLDLAKIYLTDSGSNIFPASEVGPTPSLGDKVVFAGFGRTFPLDSVEFFGSEDDIGTLHHGSNQIIFKDEKYLKIKGPIVLHSKPGETITYPGDSGAPLFNTQGQIVGILKGGYTEGNIKYSFFTNIHSGQSHKFIND
jgi:hypothetical protein